MEVLTQEMIKKINIATLQQICSIIKASSSIPLFAVVIKWNVWKELMEVRSKEPLIEEIMIHTLWIQQECCIPQIFSTFLHIFILDTIIKNSKLYISRS